MTKDDLIKSLKKFLFMVENTSACNMQFETDTSTMVIEVDGDEVNVFVDHGEKTNPDLPRAS